MRFSDLLSMSVNNLRRRKLRTFLTVLGVLIGTASIVVMVSLGIGFNELTMEQIASYGSLRNSVYSNAMWGGNESSKDPNYMTDDVIAQFGRIEHVTTASPLLETNVLMTQGAYQGYINLIGVSQEYMKNIPLKEGSIPEPGKKRPPDGCGKYGRQKFLQP
uniref:ABC transporter permease n=1 Tax=Clostridium sp. NkU-1 TaxID=1095009 RepID=UPI0032619C1E